MRAAFPRPLRGPELVLIDVDPRHLHAFWTVAPSTVDAARDCLGADTAPMVLRIVESVSADETGAAFDVEVVGLQGQCYVDVWGDARRYRGSIGFRAADGELVELVRSEPVTLPRPCPTDERPTVVPAAAAATIEPLAPAPTADRAPSLESQAGTVGSPPDQPTPARLPPPASPAEHVQPAGTTTPPAIEISRFTVHGVPPAFAQPGFDHAVTPPRTVGDDAPGEPPSAPPLEPWVRPTEGGVTPGIDMGGHGAAPQSPPPVSEHLPEPVRHPFPLPPTEAGEYEPQSLLGGFLPADVPQPESWGGDGGHAGELSGGKDAHQAGEEVGAQDMPPAPGVETDPPVPAGALPLENVLTLSSYALGRERVEFEINAELHIFGRARVGTELSLFGRKVSLRPDGTFSITRPLPSGALVLSSLLVGDDSAE